MDTFARPVRMRPDMARVPDRLRTDVNHTRYTASLPPKPV